MQNIPIFQDELSVEGLADKILAQSSVAYFSPLETAVDGIHEEIAKSIAHLGEDNPIVQRMSKGSRTDSDLYFTKSILVTTTWNKNDDVFLPQHTWAARHTPTHKPTNLEHDETRLVGHMVDCWAINDEGTVIQDNCTSDNLPSKFHLVTGAVIYKNWESSDLMDRTSALISEIEAGKKFVSMEVLFTDFDYHIINPDGNQYTKARCQDNAWMTKHLRSYGGTGEFDGYKIGRVLKNLTFCGKGYVDKPANPESIIFSARDNNFNFTSASEKNTNFEECGVFNTIGEDDSSNTNLDKEENMSDIYKEQAEKAEKLLSEANDKIADLSDKLSKADVEKYTSQIDELTATVEAQATQITELTTKTEEAIAKTSEATEALEAANTAKADLEAEITATKEAEAKANRISTLVDGGIDKEVATTKVDLFTNLNDDQWEAVAGELVSAAKAQVGQTTASEETTEATEEAVSEEETDEAEANADEEVLENVEENEADITLAANEETEDDMTEARAELQQAILASLGRDDNSKDGDE